jgi:shikimate kinase
LLVSAKLIIVFKLAILTSTRRQLFLANLKWIRDTILYICSQPIEPLMIVFLLGFMGSGKSFYAKGLSDFLHVPFVDLDQFIEEDQAMSITEIFERKGESAFRALESVAIKEVYADLLDKTAERPYKNDILGIISCGGGTPCYNGNMEWMNKHGMTIWINPSEEVILERLMKEKSTRPLVASLSAESLTDFIHQKLIERKPYYEKAQLMINQSNMPIDEFVNTIQHA